MENQENLSAEIRKQLKEKIIAKGQHWFNGISKDEMNLLFQFTNFLPNESSYSERYYYFINDLTEIAKCPVCGKNVKFIRSKHKLATFCSEICKKSEKGKTITNEKRRKFCEEKYGVDSVMKIKEIKEKLKDTFREKYGCDNPSQNEYIKEKRLKTCQILYGGNSSFCSKIVKEKVKQTNLKKYGVKNPFQSKKIKEKIKETNKKKIGV